MSTQKPTYPDSNVERTILLIIAVIMSIGMYCAGKASVVREMAGVEQAE